MAELFSSLWSEAAIDNSHVFPDGWPGSTTFPNIPPTGREMMAAVKREWKRSHPVLTAGGTPGAITLTPANAITGYVDGQIFFAKLANSLGLLPTLNVSGLGAKSVYMIGINGIVTNPYGAQQAKQDHVLAFYYDSTLNSGAGGFVIFGGFPQQGMNEEISVTCDSGAVTTGTNKFLFRLPYEFTFTGVIATLTTPQTSGSILTIDVNIGFPYVLSLFSVKLTIDNGEYSSVTATTPAQLITISGGHAIDQDTEIGIYVNQIGDGTASGLKVTLLGYQR